MRNCCQMKTLGYLSCLILFLLILSGCVSSYMEEEIAKAEAILAMDFDETNVEKVEIGKTNKSEVIAMLGNPWKIFTAANGVMNMGESERYTYIGKTRSGGINTMIVRFDSNDVVMHSEYTAEKEKKEKKEKVRIGMSAFEFSETGLFGPVFCDGLPLTINTKYYTAIFDSSCKLESFLKK